ncbi:MAG: hypothetical protein JWQ07_2857 [Ramlibacter sp.]|nr:hypothetical protein [Ramlibacter sp.]
MRGVTSDARQRAQTVVMKTIDPLLAEWVKLYDLLQEARARAKSARSEGAALDLEELDDEVARLKRLSGAVLAQIDAQYKGRKAEPRSGGALLR